MTSARGQWIGKIEGRRSLHSTGILVASERWQGVVYEGSGWCVDGRDYSGARVHSSVSFICCTHLSPFL
jgi:hypothetical protein